MIFSDPKFVPFIERLNKALYREKFHRDIPYSHTPTTTPSAKKFYFNLEEKKVFVVYSSLLFEKIILTFWEIAQKEKYKEQEPIQLLRKCFEDKGIQKSIELFSWKESFENFYEALIEESFFYFDDFENQYYFNLFRLLSNGEFTGGILHSLTRHFKDFNNYNPRPNGEIKFEYGSFFVNLMICSVNGEIIKHEKAKTENDFKITKRITIDSKHLDVVLYWDNKKELYLFTTVILRNK